MAYQELKTAIASVIKENGRHEITGNLLQDCLIAIINTLGEGYQFMGVATPETEPITGDGKYFYLAGQAGNYTHFGSDVQVQTGQIVVLNYESGWSQWGIQILADFPAMPLFVKMEDRFYETGGGGDKPSLKGINMSFEFVRDAFLSGRPVFFYRPQKEHTGMTEYKSYFRVVAYRQLIDSDSGELADYPMALFVEGPGFMGFNIYDEPLWNYCNRWMDGPLYPIN